MKGFTAFLMVLAALAAATGVWVWGDRQAQELAEWRKVWGGVYTGVTGEEAVPEGASVETLGRTVSKEFEAAKRGGADIRTSVGELQEKLSAMTVRAAVAETDLAALKREFEARQEAAVADLRAELAEQIAAARLEVAQAREERDAAVKSYAALETQLEDVKATLEAVINVPGDSMELGEGEDGADETSGTEGTGEAKGKKRSRRRGGAAVEREREEAKVAAAEEASAVAEALEETAGTEAAEVPEVTTEAEPETPETAEDPETPEEAVVAGRGVGKSGLFLTLGYSAEEGRLRLQFTGGEELVYKGVPEEVAAKVREAGDKVDAAVRERVKGKYEAEGDEEGVWKAYKRGKKGKARVEAVWVEED